MSFFPNVKNMASHSNSCSNGTQENEYGDTVFFCKPGEKVWAEGLYGLSPDGGGLFMQWGEGIQYARLRMAGPHETTEVYRCNGHWDKTDGHVGYIEITCREN